MTPWRAHLVRVFCLFFLSTPALQTFAEGPPASPTSRFFWIFAGGGISFVNSDSSSSSEVSKIGYQIDLNAVASMYFERAVWDIGGGWFYNHIEGDNVSTATIQEVTTYAGQALTSLRYRFTPWLSIGPMTGLYFGGPDVDVSFRYGAASEDLRIVSFGGGGARYDFFLEKAAVRVGADVFTDFNIPDRQLVWFQASLSIGIPFSRSNTSPSARRGKGPFENLGGQTIRVTLRDQTVYFDTDKADIASQAREALNAVSAYLRHVPQEWKAIQVEGHADYRGSSDYNYTLSLNRAAAVGKTFVDNGIPNGRVSFKAFGKTRPKNPGVNPQALAQNRRVEIKIQGVQKPDWLVEELNRVWTQYMSPDAEEEDTTEDN